ACTDDSCVGGECRHEPLDGHCDTGECFLAQCTPGTPGADAAGCTRVPVGEGDTCTSDDFACTEDVCTAGACRHPPRHLQCATGALGAAATDTSGSPGDMLAASVAEVTSTLERVARILAGKRDAPAETVWALTVAIHPGVTAPSGFPNPALERARASLEQLRH